MDHPLSEDDRRASTHLRAGPTQSQAFVFRCNFVRRNLSPEQKAEARRKMRETAKRLREENAKKWTQKRVAEALGIARETVRNWFEFATNGQTANGSHARPDARVKVSPAAKPVIAKRVQGGATYEQVAADLGISHLLELAIERNATHGMQLTRDDKRDLCRRLYESTPERERKGKKEALAALLSVQLATVHEWLSRVDKDAKAARDLRITAAWLACHSMEEIAEQEGITKETVSQVCQIFREYEKSDKSNAEHHTDFDAPLYNVWKFKEKSAGTKHFGNTEPTIVDNLLYLYTSQFDKKTFP